MIDTLPSEIENVSILFDGIEANPKIVPSPRKETHKSVRPFSGQLFTQNNDDRYLISLIGGVDSIDSMEIIDNISSIGLSTTTLMGDSSSEEETIANVEFFKSEDNFTELIEAIENEEINRILQSYIKREKLI